MSIEKERKAFEHWVSEFGLNVSTEDGLYRSHVVGWMWHAWQARAAIKADRQRRCEPVAWHTEDHLTDKSATTYDPVVAKRWIEKGWPVTPLFYAPQPAAPKFGEE